MGLYEENVDFRPHNFNTTTNTFTDVETGDVHIAQALDTMEADRDQEQFESAQTVASGAAIENENPATAGYVQYTFMEASATTSWLASRVGKRIKVTVSDSNAEEMAISAVGRLSKHATIKRGSKIDIPTWRFNFKYLALRGGSYRLYSET